MCWIKKAKIGEKDNNLLYKVDGEHIEVRIIFFQLIHSYCENKISM
jgi:hypothetical protein